MRFFSFYKLTYLGIILGLLINDVQAQDNNLPVREYTNPEEMVTFDRNTSFPRALDVINEYAQEHRGKVIIDRTDTQGNIGLTLPAMHWMDALKYILQVNNLQLRENPEFFEIITPEEPTGNEQQGTQNVGNVSQEELLATTNTPEVRINAIFFEGNRRALQEIGVDWSTVSERTPENVSDYTGSEGDEQLPGTDFEGPFVQVNSRGAQNVSQNVFNALVNFGEIGNTGINVQSLFSAFEADNLGEILASPTVRVMDSQEGRVQVGQDFSVKQRDFAGNVTDEFFSVGTILTVTPNIIEQNDTTFIHLDIEAERSSAQPDPVSTVINKQEAETQALLLDGEATVIAGLYRTEKSQVRRGLPILKDLPPWFFGLRYLFGFSSDDYLMRELVILLQVSIEPGIPERMNQGTVTNKFEALRNQRDQNRKDIEQSDRIFRGDPLIDNLDLEVNDDDELNAEHEKVAEEPEQPIEKAHPDTSELNKLTNEELLDIKPESEKIKLNLIKEPKVKNDSLKQDSAEVRKPEEELETKVDDTPSHYIIGGSFKDDENAEIYREQLESEGYKAVVLDKEDSEVQYVAYGSYESREEAEADLKEIQKHHNDKAWLYTIH